jgi:hypothetical protein
MGIDFNFYFILLRGKKPKNKKGAVRTYQCSHTINAWPTNVDAQGRLYENKE